MNKSKMNTIKHNVFIPKKILPHLRNKREEEILNDFFINIQKHIGAELTRNEFVLCGFIKLNFDTNEIAEACDKKTNSVEVARTRLRKKLGLTNTKVSLLSFLNNF